jgi:hypothetical protein
VKIRFCAKNGGGGGCAEKSLIIRADGAVMTGAARRFARPALK